MKTVLSVRQLIRSGKILFQAFASWIKKDKKKGTAAAIPF